MQRMRRMPDEDDFPPGPPRIARRPRRGLISLIVGLLVLLTAIASLAGYYVDMLWFDSLGFLSVFWYGWEARLAGFAAYFVASTLVLWIAFRILLALVGKERRPFLQIQGRFVDAPSTESVKRAANALAGLLGLIFGLGFSAPWQTYALYFNQPAASGDVDPIWGKPLTFYFFTLPVLEWLSGWLLAIAVIVVGASILLLFVGMTTNLRGVSAAGALLSLGLAARAVLSRYQLLLNDHALFSGMRYVDDKAISTGLLIAAGALIASVAILAVNRAGRVRTIALAALLPAAAYLIGGILVPWYVQTFRVRPNELALETPYIRHNINATRHAYGIDDVEVIPFDPRATGIGFDPAQHKATLDNLRLWDWKALQDTLSQMQEIRTYYDFTDVDIDRYMVDGEPTAVMLAAREIDIQKLGAGSRNWVNDRLIYTHGYGVTMNAASRFTRDGQPEFLLKDMPVQGSRPEIQVKRPEIYFGELSGGPVYVKTQQEEFNYPEGEANNFNTYEGTGGIRMGGFFRRLLLALNVGDLLAVPFSKDISSESVLLLHRNILQRVSRIAPFLIYDSDPYIVVGDDGDLYWMLDAYTTSASYPYSRHARIGRTPVNYIRNSVKAVIDAYNGSVSFYVFDPADPLIAAYQGIYPDLFKPRSAMPESLAAHVRYPELLFQLQAEVYTAYHVDSEQVFYNREDVWSIAEEARTQGSAPGSAEPIFSLMRFPGEANLEFVSIIPFTPRQRNNMIGWIAGRSDGEAYGKLRAYHLPKTKFLDGPLQIEARIDQDPRLSPQLTLWNQQGSAVIRGSMLTIPIEDTMLFVESIYLQAQRSPMPALRLIVLATQDRMAYAPTFDEALNILMAGGGGSLEPPSSQSEERTLAPPQAPAGAAGATTTQELVRRANQALADYRRLTAEGRMAEAGARLDELKTLLDRLNAGGR
jgi:uncharacterized membrane protein (UPF0182 family)